MKKLMTIALTLAGVFPFVAGAQALEMQSNKSLQLRQGPGQHYATTGQIAPKQIVKIGVCNPSWCHVSLGKKSGWVPTAQINPNMARASGQAGRHQTSNLSATSSGGGMVSSSTGGRMQASTTMTISLEIVAKDSTRGTRGNHRANTLPYPVPAHRQARSR